MNKIKKLSVIALILVVVGGIGSLTTYSRDYSISEETKEEIIKEEFNAIDIKSENAEITIIPTNDPYAKIELITRGIKGNNYHFESVVKNKTLQVILKDNWKFHIGFNLHSNQLIVHLPVKQYEFLELKNGNGKLELEKLSIETINAKMSNGKIELMDVRANNVNVETNNGKILLNHVDGNIKASTDNGKITMVTKDLDRSLQLKTDNGAIRIKTEQEPTNTRFDVDIDNGKVNILNKYTGSAIIGKGENVVELEVDNGEIVVEK